MNYKSLTLPTLIPILLLFFSASRISAQETQKSRAIKLYTNFLWDNTGVLAGTRFGYFSPAMVIKQPRGNFHEIELSRLQFNKTMGEIIIITDSIGNPVQRVYENITAEIFLAFRYDYNFRFFKSKKESRIRPYLGFSVGPYYSYLKYDPMISSSFPSKGHIFGANFSLIPRVQYMINERWFIDVNFPVNIADISWQYKKVNNPAIQENERSTSEIEISEFPAIFQFRIGLGFTL